MSRLATIKSWAQELWQQWQDDDAGTLAASVAFYAIFSLAPLLVLAVATAALIFGERAAQGELSAQIAEFAGPAGAEILETILANASAPGRGGLIATIISVAVLFYGASKVFRQLQKSLNRIWNIRPDPKAGLRGMIWQQITGFLMVLSIGLLLMIFIVLSTILSNLEGIVSDMDSGGTTWMLLNFLIQFGIFTLLFAAIFKFVPLARIDWSELWPGAALTALLFMLGQFLLSFYLSRASVGSAYGAAGSLVVVLAWLFYSIQILFLGAEFTQVFTLRRDKKIRPRKNAIAIPGSNLGKEHPA